MAWFWNPPHPPGWELGNSVLCVGRSRHPTMTGGAGPSVCHVPLMQEGTGPILRPTGTLALTALPSVPSEQRGQPW